MNLDGLSICITNKNRSKLNIHQEYLYLLPNCLKSIRNALLPNDKVEVIISDWHSTDWPLEEWLPEIFKNVSYKIIKLDGEFHRGTGRNSAADNASFDKLLFLDADMLIERKLLFDGLKYLDDNIGFFPSCFYFLNESHSKGFWCEGGRGICMLSRQMYIDVGKWPCPPSYLKAFDEDQKFFNNLVSLGIKVKVERHSTLLHQYHPGRSVDTIYRLRPFLIKDTK